MYFRTVSPKSARPICDIVLILFGIVHWPRDIYIVTSSQTIVITVNVTLLGLEPMIPGSKGKRFTAWATVLLLNHLVSILSLPSIHFPVSWTPPILTALFHFHSSGFTGVPRGRLWTPRSLVLRSPLSLAPDRTRTRFHKPPPISAAASTKYKQSQFHRITVAATKSGNVQLCWRNLSMKSVTYFIKKNHPAIQYTSSLKSMQLANWMTSLTMN